MSYDEIKKLTGKQTPDDEMIEIINQIAKYDNCITTMLMRAYFIGFINGKRSERARRAQR